MTKADEGWERKIMARRRRRKACEEILRGPLGGMHMTGEWGRRALGRKDGGRGGVFEMNC